MSKRRSRPPNARSNAPKARRPESEPPEHVAASEAAHLVAVGGMAVAAPSDPVRDELAALEAGWDELLS
jgi:hypothetical protein